MHAPPRHPIAALIVDAATGRFIAADGGWHRVPPWRPGLEAVVGFTGHAGPFVGLTSWTNASSSWVLMATAARTTRG